MDEFVVHPLRRNLTRSIMAAVSIAVVMLAFYFALGQSLLAALAAGVFLFFSLSAFFFPTAYIFSNETLTIRRFLYKQTLSLKQFRSYSIEKNGIFLSPFPDKERFDNFRGVFLVLDAKEREKVLPLIEKYIANG
ncbi:MAG: hypothetical protein V2A78_07605 [bacterium]